MIKQAEESYEGPRLEDRVRALWEERRAYEATKERRKGGERFYFVDGPPYTTGDVHVGTARNKIIKDTILRWRRMEGYDVWDQPGYDMHGLPIELLVERSLGLKNKRQIETEIGVGAFVERCRAFALERLARMTEQFRNLGVWMDWANPYMTITNGYIESAWWTLRQAHEKGLLVRSKRSLEWCPRCETPVAGYEIEYWDERDPSIFVVFPLLGKAEGLLVWTTTPWTLPANLAVAVNPGFTYAKVRYRGGGDPETLWIVEDNVDAVMHQAGIHDYEIVARAPGEDLIGLGYRHPLEEEVPVQRGLGGGWVHKVLPSDTVTKEFTGLVHTAPGHGPEDFEIGLKHDLRPLSPIDEGGRFTEEGGKYAGLSTTSANEAILQDLRKRGALLHRGEIVHRYGHCWRCDTPILYRTTDQWFIKVTAVKDRMLAEVKRVRWTPEWAGSAREYDWVLNARDWTVSRQRYWGIPLPIWECPEGHRTVVGSASELKGSEGYEEGMDLHRPWVDAVRLRCEGCGGAMSRVPDVLDVWFDSAVASWASLGYPVRKDLFEAWWPSPWIVEAHDQTRGWFYSQLGAGVVAFDRCPYDSVLMHGWVWPSEGEAFSKSRGGSLTPDDVSREYGMDALRFYELKAAPPWDDFAFHREEVRNAHRTLNILWNVHRFATLYMALDRFDPASPFSEDEARPEDGWILSRLQALVGDVTQGLRSHELHKAARALDDFVAGDLSRWYVRLIRDRISPEAEGPKKLGAYRVLHDVLLSLARLFAPFCPFLAEALYQDLGGALPTVHMEDWPTPDAARRQDALEMKMSRARAFVEEVARLRQARGHKLRWPVRKIVAAPKDEITKVALEELLPILLDQANAKAIEILAPEELWPELKPALRPIPAVIGARYKSLLPEILTSLERASAGAVRKGIEEGAYEIQVKGQPVQITSEMVTFGEAPPEGYAQGATDDVTVYVDFTRTAAIEAEGYAREVVRRVQQMRKELGLSVEDRIDVQILCGKRLRGLLDDWRDIIKRATRTGRLSLVERRPKGALVKEWDLEGDRVVISLRKRE